MKRRKRAVFGKATKAEMAQVVEEQDFWRELCKYLPWRLHGWTFKSTATYITGGVRCAAGSSTDSKLYNAIVLPVLVENQHSLLHVTGEQRDQILAAILGNSGGAK